MSATARTILLTIASIVLTAILGTAGTVAGFYVRNLLSQEAQTRAIQVQLDQLVKSQAATNDALKNHLDHSVSREEYIRHLERSQQLEQVYVTKEQLATEMKSVRDRLEDVLDLLRRDGKRTR